MSGKLLKQILIVIYKVLLIIIKNMVRCVEHRKTGG